MLQANAQKKIVEQCASAMAVNMIDFSEKWFVEREGGFFGE